MSNFKNWEQNWGIESPSKNKKTTKKDVKKPFNQREEWANNWGVELSSDTKAMNNIEQASETAKRRQIKNGVDPALKNVKQPSVLNTAMDIAFNRVPSALAGAVTESELARKQGVSEWSPEGIGAGLGGFKKGITGQQDYNFDQWLGAEGMKEGTGRNILGGTLDVLANPLIPASLKGGVGWAEKLLPQAGNLTKRVVGTGLAGGAYETGTGLGNNEAGGEAAKRGLEGAAFWGGTELGLGLAGKAIGKALGKGATKETKLADDLFDDFDDIDLGDIGGSVDDGLYSWKKPVLALPEGKGVEYSNIPNFELSSPYEAFKVIEGAKPKSLPAGQEIPMLPEGYTPNWEYGSKPTRFQSTPDGKILDLEQGSFPLAKIEGADYTANTGLKGRQRIAQDIDQTIPRSDIGDPQYIASLEQRYNEMVADEVANVKNTSKLGVEQPGLGFSDEGEVVNRWGRMSNNPQWYRDIFASNATESSPLGKEPRSGQYRDQAIKNLIEGNADTGEPASEEFHALLSELARGQKLPDEWHGLQKSIRQAGDSPELQGLISEMKSAQKQAEPYGLNKNIDRLTELENQARQRMQDRADFRRQYPDAIGIKAQNPLDDLADLATIGAVKIARGAVTFEKWAAEMVTEFGETINPQLETLWKMAQEQAGKLKQDNATKAIKKYGTTNDWREAGYLTADGKLLDFSEKNIGGPRGQRSLDHRDVNDIYDEQFEGYSDGMARFMDEGNIRMQPYGFELTQLPTREQERMLSQFITKEGGEVVVDLTQMGKHNTSPLSVEYPAGTKASKIINDIKRYYETGEEPYVSELTRFRSAEDEAIQRIKDRNTTYKPGNMNAVARNPLDDLKDLSIVGASKIAKGVADFAAWSKEMVAEFGEIIRARLSEIWEQSKAILKDESGRLGDSPTPAGEPSSLRQKNLDLLANVIQDASVKASKGTSYDSFSKELLAQNPKLEKYMPYIWEQAQTLNKSGKTEIRFKDDVVSINKGKTVNKGAPKTTYSLDGELPEPQSKIVFGKAKEPFSFGDAWKKFYTHMVDTQKPITDVGEEMGSNIGTLASNTRNVGGIVDHVLTEGMVNRNGEKVGKSLQEISELIPKGKEEDFWIYMSQRHNINRAKEIIHQEPKVDSQGFLVKDKDGNQVYKTVIDREAKPVQANYTPEMSAEAVRRTEQVNPEYKKIGDTIVKWIDDFMQTWGVDAGIVDKELYNSLREMYPSYFPTQRDVSTLEHAIPNGLSQKFANLNTPIGKAKGSDLDIINPLENIMQLVNRTIRTAKYNEVGKSLLEAVQKNPAKAKKYAEVVPVKEGMFTDKDNIISVLVNGKPQYLKINDKMLLDAMNGLPKRINDIPYVTALTQGVKDTITSKNPLFGVFNIARDVPTGYTYGSEANPIKYGADLLKASKDIVTNSERYQQYKGVGGGGANFFASSDATRSANEMMGNLSPAKKVWKGFTGKLEAFNNTLETSNRLAEFNRVLDRTGNIDEALNAANEITVNFSRGGDVTKTIDKAGGMYVNASVQGIDKFFRGFKDPQTALKTIIKSGVVITAPDLALYVINQDNPHYQALDNRTKDTYFLIPNEFNEDENGYAKTFIKIPKSRELGVLFGSLIERGLRAAEGQEDSFKGFGNTVATNFAPANPVESSLYTPLLNLATNKDFADRAIVPQRMTMDGRPKYLQYDETSTEIAKKIGELTKDVPILKEKGGLSPKQIDFVVKSYTGIIGQVVQPMATKGGTPASVLQRKFIADPAFSNQATTDFYDKLEEVSRKAVEKNLNENIPSDEVTPEEDIRNSMVGINQALSRANEQVRKINATNDPNKEAKIRKIKNEILKLTNRAVRAKTSDAMQLVEDDAKDLYPEED